MCKLEEGGWVGVEWLESKKHVLSYDGMCVRVGVFSKSIEKWKITKSEVDGAGFTRLEARGGGFVEGCTYFKSESKSTNLKGRLRWYLCWGRGFEWFLVGCE